MLAVGLTGSIAVGKTSVCDVLRELGCPVLDADHTAREVVAPGTETLREIAAAFGSEVVSPDGSLDRARMGAIVFADAEKRALLNSIVHPAVIDAQNAWLASVERTEPNAIAIVDASLMIESGGYKRFAKIIVVWCEQDIQLNRLMARNRLSRDAALARIDAQLPQDEKKGYADMLIDTSLGFDETRRQTLAVYEHLRRCLETQ